MAVQEQEQGQQRAASVRWTRADGLIAGALTASAFAFRIGAFPRDGLFHDDAWVAASVSMASPTDWLRTSVEHPAFTLLLSPLRWAAQSHPTVLVVPVLVAGALAPLAIYWMLRSLTYPRSISAVLGALVVVAPGAVTLSGHLKTYVIDITIVAVITVVLPRIADARWSALTAISWIVGTVLLGTFSSFALVATVVAGTVLVLTSGEHRGTRALAVAGQLLAQLTYVVGITRTYDGKGVESYWLRTGGYLDVSSDPLAMIRDSFAHLRGVMTTFPGGGSWLLGVTAIVAVAGLGVAALRHRAVSARFLLLLLAVAAAAAFLKLLPFGASRTTYVGRLNLWLIPAIALGLAEALRLAWRALERYPHARSVCNGLLYGFAVVVIATGIGHTPRYDNGARSATRLVESNLGARDLIIVIPRSAYSYGIETRLPARLRPDPSSRTGTRLELDPRVVQFEDLVAPDLRPRLRNTERVIFFHGVYGPALIASAKPIVEALKAAGFVPVSNRKRGQIQVTTWGR